MYFDITYVCNAFGKLWIVRWGQGYKRLSQNAFGKHLAGVNTINMKSAIPMSCGCFDKADPLGRNQVESTALRHRQHAAADGQAVEGARAAEGSLHFRLSSAGRSHGCSRPQKVIDVKNKFSLHFVAIAKLRKTAISGRKKVDACIVLLSKAQS
jgi:hypothetical protein